MKYFLIAATLLTLASGSLSLSPADGDIPEDMIRRETGKSQGSVDDPSHSGRILFHDVFNSSNYGITFGGTDLYGGAGALAVVFVGACALLFLGGIVGIPFLFPFFNFHSKDYYYEPPTYDHHEGYSSGGSYDTYQEKRVPHVFEPILTAIDNAHSKYQALKRPLY